MSPVITGRGWLTSLGRGIDPVMDRLERGESGIALSRRIATAGLRNGHCGEVDHNLPEASRDRMAALVRLAVADALQDAGLSPGRLSPDCMVIIGTSFGDIFDNADGPVALDDAFADIVRDLGIMGEPVVLSAACSSSTEALGLGWDLLVAGRCDQAIVVGIDILDRYKMAGHSSLSTMSPGRCRPFDARADGTVLGEGAAAVILESVETATRRGAPRHGRLTGVASSTDTAGATSPDPEGAGAIRVLTEALTRAGRGAADVAYVNAHGSGTPVNDTMEARALTRAFGIDGPVVSSTKPAFGHTLGATGLMEAIVALEVLRRGRAPATAGFTAPSADAATLKLSGHAAVPIDCAAPCAISVTYGFGGANSAVVVERAGS